MTSFSQLKGCLFDLHGVIADSSTYHTQAWHQLATDLGVTWTQHLAEQLLGMSRDAAVDTILAAGNMTQAFTDAEKRTLGDRKNQYYLALIQTMSPKDILPGITPFLNELQANGYGIVLASASVNAPVEIQKMQLTDYFPLIVDPKTLQHNKPDPEIYVRAAELLDLAPDQCMGFEDSQPGLAALNGSGALSVGVGEPDEIKTADVQLPSTRALTLANIERALL